MGTRAATPSTYISVVGSAPGTAASSTGGGGGGFHASNSFGPGGSKGVGQPGAHIELQTAAAPRLRRLDEESMDPPESTVETRFLVLDCSQVSGLDATSARTCFVALQQQLQQYGVTMVLTAVPARMAALLRAHKVLADERTGQGVCFALPTLEEALEWCEDLLLDDLLSHGATCAVPRGLPAILASYLDGYPVRVDLSRAASYVTRREFAAGETLFVDGQASDTLYFVEQGKVALYITSGQPGVAGEGDMPCRNRAGSVLHYHRPTMMQSLRAALLRSCFGEPDEPPGRRRRLHRYDEGGVFGQIAFTLEQRRNMHAETATSGCLYMLHRRDFEAMAREEPALALAVQTALMKSVCMMLYDAHSSSVSNSATLQGPWGGSVEASGE